MFVVLEFKAEYKGDKSTDWVLVAPTGEAFERSRTWYPVHTLKPDPKIEGQMADIMKARWDVIGPAYEAWKKGEEVPENGTPLGAWAGISQDQAKFLKQMGIVTVEAVAEMSDSAIERLPFPGRRDLPGLAAAFLKSKGEVDLAAQNEDLKARMAAMEELLAEKMAVEPQKRGPGRPRKSEAA